MNEFENMKVGDLMVMHASYCGDCLRKVESYKVSNRSW